MECKSMSTFNSLKLRNKLPQYLYQNGERLFSLESTLMIFGMSPGNSFFKQPIIDRYVSFLSQQTQHIAVISPQTPSEHTYKALGEKKFALKAKKNARHLISCAKKAIDKLPTEEQTKFLVFDWPKDIDIKQEYQKHMTAIYKLFENSTRLQDDVLACAQAVLTGYTGPLPKENIDTSFTGEGVKEAAKYILDELAFFNAFHEIYKKDICIVYYKTWGIIENYAAGDYDGEEKKWLGMVVIESREPCRSG